VISEEIIMTLFVDEQILFCLL